MGVFLQRWGVSYALRGLIVLPQAMMWLWLLQEAGEPPHPTWTGAMRDIPWGTGTLSHPQSQAAKPSGCVRALTMLNVPEEPQLGPLTTPTGPRLSYGGGCWS